MEYCQSCQVNTVGVVEYSDDEKFPYKLCKPCYHRLTNGVLRPLEFFNLRAKHGDTYLLNNDFYDFETGEADQSDIDVVQDLNLAFPKLSEIKSKREKVIDYAIVQFWLEKDVIQILKGFDKRKVLHSLNKRVKQNRNLNYKMYEIVARTLGSFAEDWARNEWKLHTEYDFPIYAEMLANCLPLEESFGYLTTALDKISSSSKLNETIDCLIYLQTEKSLDWIEQNIHRMQNLSNSWGLLAASSKLSWSKVKGWLENGRPLSLVAIDALSNLITTKDDISGVIWLRENPQRLLEPDSVENMSKVLENYLQKDNVPRTRNRIAYIIGSWNKILKLENAA